MKDKKKCLRCGLKLSLDNFYKCKKKPDGLDIYCKCCKKGFNDSWKSRNPDKYKQVKRESNVKNRSKVRTMEYVLEQKRTQSEKHKIWYSQNRDMVLVKVKTRYQNNREHYLKYQADYRINSREKIKAREERTKHRRKGTDRSVEGLRREARENARVFLFSKEDWKEVVEAFGNKCAYCQRECKLTRDHYIPVSNPSGDTVPGNIVPACQSCNSSKVNHLPMYWVEKKFGVDRLDEIVEILNRIRNKYYREVTDVQFKHLGIDRPVLP